MVFLLCSTLIPLMPELPEGSLGPILRPTVSSHSTREREARRKHVEGFTHQSLGSGEPSPKPSLSGDAGAPSSGLSARAEGVTALIECCCGPESLLAGKAVREGMTALRFTAESHRLGTEAGDARALNDLRKLIEDGHRVHLWASVPCRPWCRWHSVNWRRLGATYQA